MTTWILVADRTQARVYRPMVVGSVAKDLHAIPDHEVVAHLDPRVIASGLDA